jgi:hypothetical protein
MMVGAPPSPPEGRLALAVMARAPSDPRGKTRLLAALGSEAGIELRRAILLDTLDVARRVVGADLVVVFAPANARDELAEITGGAPRLLPQRGDGLGERLECAFVDLLALGFAGVTIIGSDVPTLPVAHVQGAVRAMLDRDDPLVLGPADDGGYYLIGLRHNHPELFRDMPWSTDRVLGRTLDAASKTALSVTLVPSWYDVDSLDDLRRVLGSKAPESSGALHTRAWAVARQHLIDRSEPEPNPEPVLVVADRGPGLRPGNREDG